MKVPKIKYIWWILAGCVLLLLIAILIGCNGKYCDWCGERMYFEETQLQQFWVHDRCYSELNKYAGYIWGNKYCIERMDWIISLVKDRND